MECAVAMEPASLENLHVLYQSTHFIVVNKHWDIRIDSKMWYEKQTVQSQLRHRFPELADPGTYYGFSAGILKSNPARGIRYSSKMAQRALWSIGDACNGVTSPLCRFCHQLDFSTSGALCVALNKAAAGRAYRCFKDRLVTKAYLALVCRTPFAIILSLLSALSLNPIPSPRPWQLRGSVEKLKTTLDFAIGKNTSQGKTHMMCIEGTDGCENPKPCQTELTVLEYGLYDGDPVTKVLLQPLT
ncbi:RNA pseudouridylate synthase domain-containing protein 1-like, partial [Scleropages formosus]